MQRPTGRHVLVTGGAGFIGGHLSGHLAEENDVRVLDALTTSTRETVPDAATLVETDLRNRDAVDTALEDVDIVFHEAALVSVDASIEDPTESHAINVEGTMNVLEAAREHDTQVVLASSAAIYGAPEAIPVTEAQPKEPLSPYGLDKLTCDHYARLYHDLYDVATVALRYFNVYGPRQTGGDYAGVIGIFMEQALADEPITVHGDGEQTRDFVFVEDIVAANCQAAVADVAGEAFNIGTGRSISIRELAELVRDLTDSDSEIVHTDPREGDIQHSQADITKATRHLDYEPAVSIEEGLERTIEWYRNER